MTEYFILVGHAIVILQPAEAGEGKLFNQMDLKILAVLSDPKTDKVAVHGYYVPNLVADEGL